MDFGKVFDGLTQDLSHFFILFTIADKMRLSFHSSRSETDETGNIFRARAKATLLTAADDNWLKLDAMRDIKRADAFWATALRSVERQKVDAETSDINIKQAERLRGVRMKIEWRRDSPLKAILTDFTNNLGDFRKGLDSAELIVSERNRN